MSINRHPAVRPSDHEELHDDFSLSEPLPSVDSGDCPDHFIESELAHLHYREHRSPESSANVATYHAVHRSGDIAGFASFRVQREDGGGSSRIFISVKHIYVMPKFRMRGLSRFLLSPLLKEVQTQLQQVKRSSSPKVYLHSTSEPESPLGERVLRKFEEELQLRARCCVGVNLIGRYYPPGARQRLWEAHLASCPPRNPDRLRALPNGGGSSVVALQMRAIHIELDEVQPEHQVSSSPTGLAATYLVDASTCNFATH